MTKKRNGSIISSTMHILM